MRRRLTILITVALLLTPPAVGALDIEEPTSADDADPLNEATIVRDDFGVAHIYADNERALWYANGYAQAQDRMWAMDLLRHLAYGEGASVVGPGGGILDMDLNTRRNLYNQTMLEEQIEDADPIFVERVEHFTDGVNRATAELQATGEMPAEFPALQHAFEPWEPIDTVAVATFLLAEFGNGGGSEVSNAQLLGQLESELGPAKAKVAFDDLVWGERADSYATIQETQYTQYDPHADAKDISSMPPAQAAATQAAKDAEGFGLDADPILPSPPSTQSEEAADLETGFFAGEDIGLEDFRLGSNALLVAPSHAEGSKALVGGGPQMGYFNPQVPYEVGLHLDGEIEAEGMGVTGAPGVIIGRTDDFAWTVTSGISDQTDTIALPADGERSYTWTDEDGNTEVRDLDCRTERHRIFSPPAIWGPANQDDPAGASSPVNVVEQEVCRADLSPVGEDPEKTYPVTSITRDEAGEPTWFFAEKTSSRMEEVASAIQWLSLDEADTFEEFQQQFEGFAFTFNFHFAGTKEDEPGDQAACYVHVGRQPVRNDALDPRFPTPAGDGWLWGPGDRPAYRTGAELPRACNPDKGYFANWNNLPQHGWSSGDSRELWGSIHRAERLDQEFQEALAEDPNDRLNLDQVKQVLEDAATEDSLANQIVPLLLNNYRSQIPDGAAQALAAWQAGGADSDFPWRSGTPGTAPDDGQTSYAPDDDYTDRSGFVYTDPGHTVYDTVVQTLMDEIFADELGDQTRSINLDPRDSSDPHAGDHGQHNNPFAVIVDALSGTTDRNWCDDVGTTPTESCSSQVEDAFSAFEGFTVSDIELTEQHQSPYTSLGVGPSFEMPMTNRATFYHFHVGTDVTQSFATLPPGVSGHVNATDFVRLTATGEPPAHMDDQLPLYVHFEHKQLPWGLASAQDGAESTQSLVVPPAGP